MEMKLWHIHLGVSNSILTNFKNKKWFVRCFSFVSDHVLVALRAKGSSVGEINNKNYNNKYCINFYIIYLPTTVLHILNIGLAINTKIEECVFDNAHFELVGISNSDAITLD